MGGVESGSHLTAPVQQQLQTLGGVDLLFEEDGGSEEQLLGAGEWLKFEQVLREHLGVSIVRPLQFELLNLIVAL
jgi:hypothetical protein